MATHGVLCEPWLLGSLELLPSIPQGTLSDPYLLTDAEGIVSPIRTSVFPTPPAAFGFLIDEFAEGFPYDKVQSTLTNAVHPEGSYLEPTEGQIWPR